MTVLLSVMDSAADRKLKQAVREHSRWLTPWLRMRCEDCGKKATERHHPSYHSFDVVWLCKPCHEDRHPRDALGHYEPTQ